MGRLFPGSCSRRILSTICIPVLVAQNPDLRFLLGVGVPLVYYGAFCRLSGVEVTHALGDAAEHGHSGDASLCRRRSPGMSGWVAFPPVRAAAEFRQYFVCSCEGCKILTCGFFWASGCPWCAGVYPGAGSVSPRRPRRPRLRGRP
jgi:hypothetical protein